MKVIEIEIAFCVRQGIPFKVVGGVVIVQPFKIVK